MVFPAYFSNVNKFFPVIDEDLFMPRAEMLYTIDRPHLNVIDYCLFYVSVALGAQTERRRSKQPEAVDRQAATSYQQAWDLVQGSFASPRESTVQILLLHVRCFDSQLPTLPAKLSLIGLISHVLWDPRYGVGILRPGHSYCAISRTASEKPTRHGFSRPPDLAPLATLGHRLPL